MIVGPLAELEPIAAGRASSRRTFDTGADHGRLWAD